MNTFNLIENDSMQAFELGLRSIGVFDCVSEHRNRFRKCLILGQSRAWTEIDGRDVPVVIDWKAKITIAEDVAHIPQANIVLQLCRNYLSNLSGRWLTDIRSEARSEGYPNLAQLVTEDIERGDLPNRLVFNRGLVNQVYPQIAMLRLRLAADPTFDWRRVRVDVSI